MSNPIVTLMLGFLGGIRGPELILILVIVMIVFGVGRLPEVGGAMGKAIREFRKSQSGIAETLAEDDSEGESAEKEKSVT